MPRLNITAPTFTYDDDDPEGFRSGVAKLGPALGAVQTGASVYELPPGQAICPYHYEYAEEEWALVLEGRPTSRTPAGTEQLEPLDVLYFARGPEGAHQLRNETDAPVRLLMWSPVLFPAATAYPDSDKVGVWTGDKAQDLIVQRSSAVEYFHGEGGRATPAARSR